MRRRTLLLLALLAVVAAAAFVFRVGEDMIDFEVDYVAGQRLRAGESLYQAEDGHYAYKYLPGAAVLESPFSLLPLDTAKAVFYAVTVCCLAAAMRLSWEMLPDGRARRPVLAVWTFVILGKYILREIDLGQINLIILVLLLLSVKLLLPSEEKISAAALQTLKALGVSSEEIERAREE